MSRTSKYYEPVKTVYRQVRCRWCGKELEHAATGRAKEYCSGHCRVYYNRARKEYASRCVDAALAGEPEPEQDFGYPIELAHYVINDDGTTTRRDRRDWPGDRAMDEAKRIKREGVAFLGGQADAS
jgi:hypothetical protein